MVNCVRPSLTCHRHRVELGRCQYSAQPGRIPISIPIPLMDIIFPADQPLRTCLSSIGREIERVFGFDRTQMNTNGWILVQFFRQPRSEARIITIFNTHNFITVNPQTSFANRERDHCFKRNLRKKNPLNFSKNILYMRNYFIERDSLLIRISAKVVRVGIPITLAV